MNNTVFIVGLSLGGLMLVAVCWVYITKQKLAPGGSVLTVCGIVLVGMSVWRTIDISVGVKGINAKLEHVENQVLQVQGQTATLQRKTDELTFRFDVVAAQQALQRLGYPGFVDGFLGPGTKESIRRFQMAKGLPETGELDERTKIALGLQSQP